MHSFVDSSLLLAKYYIGFFDWLTFGQCKGIQILVIFKDLMMVTQERYDGTLVLLHQDAGSCTQQLPFSATCTLLRHNLKANSRHKTFPLLHIRKRMKHTKLSHHFIKRHDTSRTLHTRKGIRQLRKLYISTQKKSALKFPHIQRNR